MPEIADLFTSGTGAQNALVFFSLSTLVCFAMAAILYFVLEIPDAVRTVRAGGRRRGGRRQGQKGAGRGSSFFIVTERHIITFEEDS